MTNNAAQQIVLPAEDRVTVPGGPLTTVLAWGRPN